MAKSVAARDLKSLDRKVIPVRVRVRVFAVPAVMRSLRAGGAAWNRQACRAADRVRANGANHSIAGLTAPGASHAAPIRNGNAPPPCTDWHDFPAGRNKAASFIARGKGLAGKRGAAQETATVRKRASLRRRSVAPCSAAHLGKGANPMMRYVIDLMQTGGQGHWRCSPLPMTREVPSGRSIVARIGALKRPPSVVGAAVPLSPPSAASSLTADRRSWPRHAPNA